MVIDPGNNINTGAGSGAGKARQAPPAREPSSQKQNANTLESSDTVSLSSTAQSLSKAEAELARTSEVDESKVAEMKAAIANGSYQVDADSIANRMLKDDISFL